MEIKEAVIEAIKSLIIPELDEIKKDIAVIKTRLDGMDKRFEDMNNRFDDMNKRFEEHFNFNMKKFEALELQIFNILEEIRDIRRVLEKKVDLDEFRRLENNYLELLKEITLMKTKLPA